MRRALGEIIRDPQGRVSEAKVFSALGKAALLYVLIAYTPALIERWEVLAVIVLALIAPDLLKKLLTLRFGVAAEKKEGA